MTEQDSYIKNYLLRSPSYYLIISFMAENLTTIPENLLCIPLIYKIKYT